MDPPPPPPPPRSFAPPPSIHHFGSVPSQQFVPQFQPPFGFPPPQLPLPPPYRPIMPPQQPPNTFPSYTFAPPHSFAQPLPPQAYPPPSQLNVSTPAAVPPSITHAPTNEVVTPAVPAKPTEEAVGDWIQHTSGADGRMYYYNKRTRQSTWEKPLDLLTPIERADASTDWKEFTSPDGRKYFYNKVTKQSKWTIPEELKLAREQLTKVSTKGTQSETCALSQSPVSVPPSIVQASTSVGVSASSVQGVASTSVQVAPVAAADNPQSVMVSGSSGSPVDVASKADEVQFTPVTVGVSESAVVDVPPVIDAVTLPMNDDSSSPPVQESVHTQDGNPTAEDTNETRKDVVEKSSNSLDKKGLDQETLSYTNKQEAKNAFKALLESANVASDWTWDQAMRAIINDRRYGAIKSLGERKQVFNEFIVQKKKQDAEERWTKQKKAREEFRKMLEECKELTSSSAKLSKVMTIIENDERFKVVEREKDRRDLIEDYIDELRKQERARAQEERKRKLIEYRQFLESCEFIKTNTQWRKVQDRLEVDERCLCLEKIDRLEIFQVYLNDLERDEEEKRKIQKEEMRKAERKNRDEFRKFMEGHVADGTLTAKTHWLDYSVKVKDVPAYLAVASNTSGSTPKDLFEDVIEELHKQYHEDKARIKDAVKLRKILLTSSWILEDLKAAIAEDVSNPSISDINIKFAFDELLERAREKEEKEAKKRKRLSDNFFDFLRSIKDITSSSNWESCKQLFHNSPEYSKVGDESTCKGIFEEYVLHLKDQEKENERIRKEDKAKKEKERDDKDRRKRRHGRDRDKGHEDSENAETAEIYEKKRSEKDGNKKHRKRHRSGVDDSNENENNYSKDSDRQRKSRRHASTPESEGEGRQNKTRKREHWNGSRRNGDHSQFEDGEYGERR